MHVLITGGAGFLGSHLCAAFLARGDRVTCLDRQPPDKVQHLLPSRDFTYVHGSVLDATLLASLMRGVGLVYHHAAVVGVQHYVADPYAVLNVNVNGTQEVLRAAHHAGAKVVFASTSEVYGRNPKVPWAEDDDRVLGATAVDRWCYSTSKAVGEHFCHAYGRNGLDYVIVRYFNIYGPRLDALDHGRVVTIFLGQLLAGRPLTVVGDGSQTRCFTYVDDAIRATVAAGLKPQASGGTFNIGTEAETSILELAQTLVRLSGTDLAIEFVPAQTVYGKSYEDIPRRVPDVTAMRTVLGVTADTTLEAGLRPTYEWFATQAGRRVTIPSELELMFQE